MANGTVDVVFCFEERLLVATHPNVTSDPMGNFNEFPKHKEKALYAIYSIYIK